MKIVNYLVVGVIGASILTGGPIYLPVKIETAQQVKSTTNNSQIITKEEALQIALDAAGAKKDAITKSKVKLEEKTNRLSKNRHPYVYEVEFDYNGFEYDFEIDALTKEVLHSEIDKID